MGVLMGVSDRCWVSTWDVRVVHAINFNETSMEMSFLFNFLKAKKVLKAKKLTWSLFYLFNLTFLDSKSTSQVFEIFSKLHRVCISKLTYCLGFVHVCSFWVLFSTAMVTNSSELEMKVFILFLVFTNMKLKMNSVVCCVEWLALRSVWAGCECSKGARHWTGPCHEQG